jgi:alcohol dehydrogenase
VIDFELGTRVVYGPGTLHRVGEFARHYQGHRILLVTDKGLAKAGHDVRCLNILLNAGCEVTVFDDVNPNPSTDDVERGLYIARQAHIDMIVGLGGGSSMDCAKGINFLLTNGGKMQDYWGIGKATKKMLPFIAIPTTAGTGSEAQSFALITDINTHQKMACGDKKSAAKVAILDPELTLTMPASVTAVTGIDAISHALETYVSTKRNPISQVFSREAWKLLSQSFETVLTEPKNLAARGSMLLGAHYSGMAIEQSMLGAAHAMANPLTAHFGLTHGIAIGLVLPHVLRFNGKTCAADYKQLVIDVGMTSEVTHDPVEMLAQFITQVVKKSNGLITLAQTEFSTDMISQLSQEAAKQWTGTYNPRPLSEADFEGLYQCLWK